MTNILIITNVIKCKKLKKNFKKITDNKQKINLTSNV